jgi:putative tricarboxylic transport membrane protein
MNLIVGQLGLRLWTRVVRAPEAVVFSSAILLCIAGVALSTGGLFGVAIMLIFAALGYVMTSFGYSVVIFIIAFFLGDRFERSLSQALVITNGEPSALIDHPVAILLILVSLISLWRFGLSRRRAADGEAS